MKVLHVASGFASHPLYPQLVRHLREHCEYQLAFAPVRSAAELDRQPADEPGVLEYAYRRVLRPAHRVFFRRKIHRVFAELCRTVGSRRFDVLHAHTLYSDGAVALRGHAHFGIPYIVAVRNTDLNYFEPLRPDLRGIRDAVLRRARRVIFISPAYRLQLLSRLRGALRDDVTAKSVVVPNGVGPIWLEPWTRPPPQPDAPLRLLYVGDLSANKNVVGLLRAAASLHARRELELTLVGAGGSHESRIRRSLEAGEFPFARWLGRIEEPQRLREVYRRHDVFAMPSHTETFGIAYLEALSQGLPVIHARGQGIDGLVEPGKVGEAVDPGDIQQIAHAIETLSARLGPMAPRCIAEARDFSWQAIALKYDEIYRSVAAE